MKRILLFSLLVISVHAQSQKTVTPNWVKSVAQDTATVLRAEIALKMNSSAFADSFNNRFSATSIAAIKEVAEYGRAIADSSILLYSGGVWSIFDLSEALSATANNAINITYPDANTISFNDTNVLLLDPLTLEINGSNQLTVIGGTGGSVGNADSLGGKPASEYLVKNDSTAQRTFSDLKYVDKASTQTITGNKTFSGNKTVFGTTTNDSVRVTGRLQVNNLGIGSKYNLATGTGFMFNKSTMKQQNFTGASLINHISNFDLDATGAYIIWGLTGSSGSGLFTYNLEPYGFGINSLYAQPIYIGINSFMSLGLFPLKTYMEIDSLKFGSLVNNVFTPANKVTIVADTFNFWGTTYINGTKYAPNGSVADADSLGGLPASDYVTKAGINEWSTNLYSGSANVMRLGKSYNDKRFNNGAYSDVWNIDYVIPPYNLSADWLYSIEHRTDYFNDTLNTIAHSDIVNIDGTGTPIWKTNDVRIMGNEIAVNVGDLPDSVALNWSLAGLTGNKVILSEANKTAVESRFPMPVRGFEFKFGSVPNYIFPRVYSFFSDLTTNTPSLETAYHFYGQGSYPSYFGGNILTDGTILVNGDTVLTQGDTEQSTHTVTQIDDAVDSVSILNNRVSALEDSLSSIRNVLNSILSYLDTCGCGSVNLSDNTPPAKPTSYVAVGGTSQTQYTATWTDPVDADLSKIYWYEGSANDSTTLALVDSINAGVQTYTRTGRTANTTYWSAVKAVDDSGNVSWFSNLDSATTQSTGGASPIATLDFEEGDLSEWSSTSGANLSASNTVAHTGTYSMRVGTNSYGIYNFTADTEVWLTFWLYLPSTSSQSASYNYISMFNNGIADRSCFGTNNGTWSEWLVGVNSGNMTDNDFTTNFSQNTWHKIKIYYQTNGTTTSNHQVWVDDTSIWSTTAAYVNSVSNFTVGSEAATITNYFYIDDIKLYTSDPGTQD